MQGIETGLGLLLAAWMGPWQFTFLELRLAPLGLRMVILGWEDLNTTGWMDLPPGAFSLQVEPWVGKLYLGLRVMGFWILRPRPTEEERENGRCR